MKKAKVQPSSETVSTIRTRETCHNKHLAIKAKTANAKKVYDQLMKLSSETNSSGVFDNLIQHHLGPNDGIYGEISLQRDRGTGLKPTHGQTEESNVAARMGYP